MNFEEKLNNLDKSVKEPIKAIDKISEGNDFDDLEFENSKQINKAETEQELEKVRQEISESLDIVAEEKPGPVVENQTAEEQKTNLLDIIKNNKWLKRFALASAIGTSVFNPVELNAQTEKEALSKNKLELSAVDSTANNDLEKERAEKLKTFSMAINKMIVYNSLYPNSHFLEKWSPDEDEIAYFNEHMIVGRLDNQDTEKWKDKKEYDVEFTEDKKGNLVNFLFRQIENNIKTLVGYNPLLGRELSALRYSYQEQPGFKKITANEFEGSYAGLVIVTEPGYREDMNHHYVWVDDKLDEQKVIDNVLADFNHDDAFPELEKK